MKRLRPVLSVMLSLLVLVSGTSFIVGVHHCNGHVASVALFTKATPCPMEQKAPPPCHQSKKSCCSDERIVHDSDDLKPTTSAIHVLATPLVAELASPIVIATLIPSSWVLQVPPIDSSPPLPLPDIQIAQSKFQI